MSGDPFERFERSRGGFLIPVLLFCLGAIPTTMALKIMDPLVTLQDAPKQGDAGDLDRAEGNRNDDLPADDGANPDPGKQPVDNGSERVEPQDLEKEESARL